MAPAQIPVFLSQKPSTENGQFRVVALRLAWGRAVTFNVFCVLGCVSSSPSLSEPASLPEPIARFSAWRVRRVHSSPALTTLACHQALGCHRMYIIVYIPAQYYLLYLILTAAVRRYVYVRMKLALCSTLSDTNSNKRQELVVMPLSRDYIVAAHALLAASHCSCSMRARASSYLYDNNTVFTMALP